MTNKADCERAFVGLKGGGLPVIVLSVVLLSTAAPSSTGNTLPVPSQYATIQAAIDAASAGDEVVLAPGVYTGAGNRDLNFGGKAITLRSVDDTPGNCVIDCEYQGRGLTFNSGETAAAAVRGLTIRNGIADGASGWAAGGGALCEGASPTFIKCCFQNNRASEGGAVYCANSDASLTDCILSGNVAEYQGSALWCAESSPTLTGCTISGQASVSIYCGAAHPTFANCTISDGASAGVYCVRASAVFTNCIIANNGIGVIARNSSPTITNCTFSGNDCGVSCSQSSRPVLTNCILWGNTQDGLSADDDSYPVVAYCDVQGGWEGTGNIDADPRSAFIDDFRLLSGSPCIDAGTETPAGGLPPKDIDGQPRPLDGDADGRPVPDLGAHEACTLPTIALSPKRFQFFAANGRTETRTVSIRNSGPGVLAWEVSSDAPWLRPSPAAGQSTGDTDVVSLDVVTAGLTPGTYAATVFVAAADACNSPQTVAVTLNVGRSLQVPADYATIQAALDAATLPGDEVVLADGCYRGPGNRNLDFGGKPVTLRSVSDDPTFCVIDCEHQGRGLLFSSRETADSVVRGITICNGEDDSAGGVWCCQSSPTFANCVIRDNVARRGQGGGMYLQLSHATLINCIFAGNSAYDWGNALYCVGSDPLLTNCTVVNNPGGRGIALSCAMSEPVITNCIFWGHTVAINATPPGIPVVTYCDVQGGWEGMGNIDVDPNFAFQNDLHLMPGSACVDAGTSSAPALPAQDREGQPRQQDGDGDGEAGPDMGAFELNPSAPTIALEATEVVIFAPQGFTGSQTIRIRNSSPGILHWTATSDDSWLSITPPTGESSGEIDTLTLTADATNLATGPHDTTVWLSDPNACNSPLAVSIILHVIGAISVPSQYPTIQAAIAVAVDGDEVVIADGVYTGPGNRDLSFGGKAITVRSLSGDPATCIIDCEQQGRGFCFQNSESAASVVRGLTVRNGIAEAGGAVYCGDYCSPVLANCVFTGNTAASGGAVYGDPTLISCALVHNAADDGGGLASSGYPFLINCTIANNTAASAGGGAYSSGWGQLINCVIAGNSSDYVGGYMGPAFLTNCTITGNTASSGPVVEGFYNPVFNCILWGNTPEELGSLDMRYCDVQGGYPGEGNVDIDPLFWDSAAGDYQLSPLSPCIDAARNDLMYPDTGDLDGDGDTTEPIPFDLLGQPRLVDDWATADTGSGTPPLIDMGAVEYQSEPPAHTTLAEFFSFADCMRGPDVEVDAGCDSSDFQRDGDADLVDFIGMQRAFIGAR